MKPLIAGNWKMNKLLDDAVELAGKLKVDIKDADVLICPSFVCLSAVNEIIKGSNVMLGAQNVFYEEEGAFTGEISCKMLKSVGCSYVIIGHSERRQYFGEDDVVVNKKIKTALKNGLKVIVCVGENPEQREKGEEKKVVENQVKNCLKNISKKDMADISVAYEPVWAIGTGKTATPEQAQEIHALIRETLKGLFDEETAGNTRILYGGSVKPDNTKDLMKEKDINGALVGGASLDADSFAGIIKNSV